MDWSNILDNSSRPLIGVRDRRVRTGRDRPERPVRLHRTAELRPGGVHGGRRLRPGIDRRDVRLVVLVGILVGFAGVVVLALLLGVPTLRLRADYLAIVTIAAAEIIRLIFRSVTLRDTFGGTDGISGFSNDFYALNPYDDRRRVRPVQFGPGTCGCSSSAGSSSILAVPHRVGADAQPVGPGAQGDPRGRGRRAQPRQERVLVQDAGADPRRRARRLGGFIFALAQAAVQPDNYSPNLTFYAYTILILGGVARVLGPVVGAMIFWCLLQLTAGVLRRAVAHGVHPDLVDRHQRRSARSGSCWSASR